MVEIIEESFFKALKESLGVEATRCDDYLSSGHISRIDIDGDKNHTISIIYDDDFLLYASSLMLFEEDPDDKTKLDLSNELTNIIVGVSKVIASSADIHYSISTPKYEGFGEFQKSFDYALSFVCDDNMCTLYIGSKNG